MRHTAPNIYDALKELLIFKKIPFSKVIGNVGDNPNVMISFRNLMKTNHPHIIQLRCVLHDFNTIAKHVLNDTNIPQIKKVIKNNKDLVNYFTESFYYDEILSEWRLKNEIKHGLDSYTESRWYSFAKIFLAVLNHEEGKN